MKTFKLFGMIVLIKLGLDLITVSNSDSLVLWVKDYAVVNSSGRSGEKGALTSIAVPVVFQTKSIEC